MLGDDSWAHALCRRWLSYVMAMTWLLYNIALFHLVRAWPYLDLLIADVIVVLVGLHLIGLESLAWGPRAGTWHSRLGPASRRISISVIQSTVLLKSNFLNRLRTACVLAIITMAGEIFASSLVTSLINLRYFFTYSFRVAIFVFFAAGSRCLRLIMLGVMVAHLHDLYALLFLRGILR